MRVPEGPWLRLDETESTQQVAAQLVADGSSTAVVIANHQTEGRGRFGRHWVSQPGSSLAASLIFQHYADHKQPWLIAMTIAAAAAGVLHCQLRWPNDLTVNGKKLGGILTEMLPGKDGRLVPVVGVGINLGPIPFPPELIDVATTLADHGHGGAKPETMLQRLIDRLQAMPEPESWQTLEPIWRLFDDTPGKLYKLPSGEEAIAIGVGPAGELLCSVDGESTTVMAADAFFG